MPTSQTQRLMDDIRRNDLPPSAKFVLNIIEERDPVPRREILTVTESVYQERTVEDALKTLRENGFVERQPHSRDGRETVYHRVSKHS